MTTTLPGAEQAERRRIDWGRAVMVPAAVLFGGAAVAKLAELLAGEGGAQAWAAVGTALLTAAFYGLMVWAYLRRGAARATSTVTLALLAAPVATFLPFALPHVGTGSAPGVVVVIGDVLLVAGLAFSVWSLRHLDRCLSVVPQARQVVDTGPYAKVRHPLYSGEIVAMLGLALTLGGLLPLLLWLALAGLQAYRAVQEEALLAAVLPGYSDYAARTARILPWVF